MSIKTKPQVTIGIPCYNSEKTIERTIMSIRNQTYKKLRIIISNNNSTDDTYKICKKHSDIDDRIKVFNQPENIGPSKNFQFLYNRADTKYFMWIGSDDIISHNFLENALKLITSNNNSFVSGINNFDDNLSKNYDFSIKGNTYERLNKFLEIKYNSHSCFYSLFKRDELKNYSKLSKNCVAFDWMIICHLLKDNNFLRLKDSKLTLGSKGASKKKDLFEIHKNNKIKYVFPYFDFSFFFIYLVMNSNEININNKMILIYKTIKFNFRFITRFRLLIGI